MFREQLINRINEMQMLESNWDFNEADPIDKEAIANAYILVNEIDIEPDAIVPLPCGTIQIEWKNERNYFEIEICKKTFILWLVDDASGYSRTATLSWEDGDKINSILHVFFGDESNG